MQTETRLQSPTKTQAAEMAAHRPTPADVRRAIKKRSFATLATTSAAGRPHVAGVLFESIHDVLYINTLRTSRKARNILDNPHVAVCLPVRRLPVGPPSTIQFQAKAEVLDLDSPAISGLVEAGHLKSLTSHGELELSDGCFLRIPLSQRLITYGLGMSIPKLIGDPLHAGGFVNLGID